MILVGLYLLLLILTFCGYIVGLYFAIVYAGIPLLLLSVPVGVSAGLLWGAGRVLEQWPATHRPPQLWTPDSEVAHGAVDTPMTYGVLRTDHAWAVYFIRQFRYDVSRCWLRLWSDVRSALELAREATNTQLLVVAGAFPITLPLLIMAAAAVGGMFATAVVMTVVACAGWILYWTVGMTAMVTLRSVDSLWRIVFGTEASCPTKYHVTPLPVFRCPGPHTDREQADNLDLHADIRPGRLGVLARVCGCGERLPTTVIRASRILDPYCRTCSAPLPDRAGLARDVRIGVFGATSAGKTHLLASGLVRLYRHAQDGKASLSILDRRSRRQFDELSEIVDQGRSTISTEAVLPTAISLQVRRRWQSAHLHFFDAAGVALADEEQNARHSYLDRSRTLIFVIDPFSLSRVRDRAPKDLVDRAAVARDDPETAYRATTGRLQRYGVSTAKQNLAIVVSKADLLAEVESLPRPHDSGSVERWLSANGMESLVTGAKTDFKQVRFFLSSAVDVDAGQPDAAFRWLLRTQKVVVE